MSRRLLFVIKISTTLDQISVVSNNRSEFGRSWHFMVSVNCTFVKSHAIKGLILLYGSCAFIKEKLNSVVRNSSILFRLAALRPAPATVGHWGHRRVGRGSTCARAMTEKGRDTCDQCTHAFLLFLYGFVFVSSCVILALRVVSLCCDCYLCAVVMRLSCDFWVRLLLLDLFRGISLCISCVECYPLNGKD